MFIQFINIATTFCWNNVKSITTVTVSCEVGFELFPQSRVYYIHKC